MTTVVDWQRIDDGLTGPDFLLGDEFYGVFDIMRAEDPVHWTKGARADRGFWSLTRYADCLAVLDDPELFSNKAGSQIPPKGPAPTPEYLYKIGADVRLTQQDPPLHTQLRRPLNPHFSVPASRKYRESIEAIVDELIERISHGKRVDLVEDLCAQLPVYVFLKLMDVPENQWSRLRELAASIVNPDDPALAKGRDSRAVQADGFAETFEYMRKDLMRRRECPSDDFASMLAGLKLDGEFLSERWVGWMATTIVAAGLETTRDASALGLRELIRDPRQADLLRSDPGLVGSAVEEVLRWSTPPRQRLRVATADTVIDGKQIKKDDWVVAWLSAANRDPRVFDRPNEFDITRQPNPHLTFSSGTHICLGRNLARIELELLIVKFLQAFSAVNELEPGPQWNGANNVIASLKSYPVELVVAAHPVAAAQP